MMKYSTLAIGLMVAGSIAGCKPPLHLTYDFGRAYIETLRVQADFTRPSVVGESYYLYGTEGVLIRVNAQNKATREELGQPTVSQ
jgi:hypothetical protein